MNVRMKSQAMTSVCVYRDQREQNMRYMNSSMSGQLLRSSIKSLPSDVAKQWEILCLILKSLHHTFMLYLEIWCSPFPGYRIRRKWKITKTKSLNLTK